MELEYGDLSAQRKKLEALEIIICKSRDDDYEIFGRLISSESFTMTSKSLVFTRFSPEKQNRFFVENDSDVV
jgi:hypothetical protein